MNVCKSEHQSYVKTEEEIPEPYYPKNIEVKQIVKDEEDSEEAKKKEQEKVQKLIKKIKQQEQEY